MVFGSVGGGGRYDGLVKRFTGQDVPATGFSIGVSRLMTALKNLGKLGQVRSRSRRSSSPSWTAIPKPSAATRRWCRTCALPASAPRCIRATANAKFGNQLQYADRRDCPIAIIQGSDEREKGIVQIKDMIEGRKQAAAIESNEEWRETRPGQFEVDEAMLVAESARSGLVSRRPTGNG